MRLVAVLDMVVVAIVVERLWKGESGSRGCVAVMLLGGDGLISLLSEFRCKWAMVVCGGSGDRVGPAMVRIGGVIDGTCMSGRSGSNDDIAIRRSDVCLGGRSKLG